MAGVVSGRWCDLRACCGGCSTNRDLKNGVEKKKEMFFPSSLPRSAQMKKRNTFFPVIFSFAPHEAFTCFCASWSLCGALDQSPMSSEVFQGFERRWASRRTPVSFFPMKGNIKAYMIASIHLSFQVSSKADLAFPLVLVCVTISRARRSPNEVSGGWYLQNDLKNPSNRVDRTAFLRQVRAKAKLMPWGQWPLRGRVTSFADFYIYIYITKP